MLMGWLIPLFVLLPNVLLVRFPPTERPEDASGVNRWLEALERLGQAGVFVIPCFYRIRIQGAMAVVSLAVMALTLVSYYLGWLRYMQQGRRYALLFAPMWGIPLPMAVMPVIYFGAAAALVRSCPLAAATAVFAVGHLAVSAYQRRKVASLARGKTWTDSLRKENLMSDSILIAYATRYGSTREVADKIAATLREGGLAVDLQPVKQVRTLDPYRAVVVGAPLYMFDWLKEARDFLSRHRTALEEMPVAVFALGPTEDKEEDWTETRQQLDKVLSKFPWLKPVAVKLFGGKFDPARLTFPYNLIPALKRMPVNDIRDWEAIQAWACSLVEKLGP